MRPLIASRTVARPPAEVFARLADLRGHWDLAGPWVEPVELRRDGGTVRVRGPLGLRRTITTMLTATWPERAVCGEARSRGTRAEISWLLEPRGDGTHVTLRAEVVRRAPVDGLLLRLGGRWWMQRRFTSTLQRLG